MWWNCRSYMFQHAWRVSCLNCWGLDKLSYKRSPDIRARCLSSTVIVRFVSFLAFRDVRTTQMEFIRSLPILFPFLVFASGKIEKSLSASALEWGKYQIISSKRRRDGKTRALSVLCRYSSTCRQKPFYPNYPFGFGKYRNAKIPILFARHLNCRAYERQLKHL